MIVTHVYKRDIALEGGVETYIRTVAKYLGSYGIDVYVLTPSKTYLYLNGKIASVRHTTLSSIFNVIKDTEIIHLHGLRDPFGLLISSLTKASTMNKRVLMTVHTVFPYKSLIDKIAKICYDTIFKLSNTIDLYLFVADHVMKQFSEIVSNYRGVTLPLPVDLEELNMYVRSCMSIYDYLNLEHRHRIVLFVGRFCWQKDPLRALRLFRYVVKQLDDIMLLMVSKGISKSRNIYQYVEKLGLKNNVKIIDGLPRKILMRAYADSSLVIMTSRYEGSPYVMLESFAVGTPVFAPRIPAIEEILRRCNIEECLYDPKYSDYEISKKLIELLNNEKLLKEISRRAKSCVEKVHDAKKHAKMLREIYLSIIENR